MDIDQHKKSFSIALVTAQVVGATLGAINKQEAKNTWERLNFLVSGLAITYYCTPWFCKYFQHTEIEFVTITGFGFGLFGGAVVQSLMGGIQKFDILRAIMNKFGLGG